MRTLDFSGRPEDLGPAISRQERADYVYMYPPRQSYRPIVPTVALSQVKSSLADEGPLNLYFHVPFCKQICAYCNLFAVVGSSTDEHSNYVDLLMREFDFYLPLIVHRRIDTIYIGGGTPSLVSPLLIAKLIDHVSKRMKIDISLIPEVALEVAPESVTKDQLVGFRDAGINRVNLGMQTWDPKELASTGRRSGILQRDRPVEIAMSTGFDNVCVDLIYGLPAQTNDSWDDSLKRAIALRPPTICCYALTLRDKTGYSKRGYTVTDNPTQYYRYDRAVDILGHAGYVQQTHVRWVLPQLGGYRQKENHWAGQDLLGFGAGARSYLKNVDTRNGYSVTHRRASLASYVERIQSSGYALTSGFEMDSAERLRKATILGLGGLDRLGLTAITGRDVADHFPREFDVLSSGGYIEMTEGSVQLTSSGQKYRDVIVQLFFSKRVMDLVAEFNYDE